MENIKSYLSFKIGDEYFAANVSFIHNIIEYCKITKVPEMPDYMLGVINLRGQVLPVIDSRLKFGIDKKEITGNTCIIVMEVEMDNQQVFVGVLVDGVSEVVELSENQIKESPSIGGKIKNDFISGVYQDDDKFTMVLDMNKVISEEEVLALKEVAE